MILQSLVKYYETLEKKGEITRPGWSKEKAAFALVITENGELNRVIPLKIEKLKGKKMVWEARTFTVPQRVTRSSGIASNFLCDHASYLLGIDKKGKPKRTLECFLAAKAKHLEILEGVDSIAARAVCNFFKNWQPEHAANSPALADDLEEIMSGENLIFQVEDIFAQEDSLIKKAWEKYSDQTEKGVRGTCLVTGQQTEIARIHGTIKGVQGAQPSGAALVSFNAPALESYGKEQSFNAPVGTYAVYAYTTVLNHHLADHTHTRLSEIQRLYIGLRMGRIFIRTYLRLYQNQRLRIRRL